MAWVSDDCNVSSAPVVVVVVGVRKRLNKKRALGGTSCHVTWTVALVRIVGQGLYLVLLT